jgi:CheY-like chemotaxis protein
MLGIGTRTEFPTVLLIDDDLVSREVMATLLTLEGYTVHTAEGGQIACDLLTEGGFVPAVILMDAQMPGLSGVRLINELRARCQALVFAVSGSYPPEEVMAAADAFLLKPFGPEALGQLLEKLVLRDEANAQNAAPLATEDAEPIVDLNTLRQLREMMSEAALREIYAAIVADLFKRLALLEAAVAGDDLAQVHRIGHSIKGGCAMAGALEAARLGALLEGGILDSDTESDSNNLEAKAVVIRDLRTAALNLERMLEAGLPA